jgi:hypothetical protein
MTLLSAGGVFHSGTGSPFRVYIDDRDLAHAAADALTGASEWLEGETCQSLFSEFLDDGGAPLTDKLRRLETTPQQYLRLVIFVDGESHGSCNRDGVLAFTVPHSRVVYLCGREFEGMARRSAQNARVVVIHEMLHTLGLGENPPTSREINVRVRQHCWK